MSMHDVSDRAGSRSERGAANLGWLIILFILSAVGGIGTYYYYDLLELEITKVQDLNARIVAKDTALGNRNGWLKDLSDVVGWSATDLTPERPRTDDIARRIGDLRDKFDAIQTSDATLQQVIEGLIKDHDSIAQKAIQSAQSFDAEVLARNALQDQKSQVETDKAREIADLNDKLKAERDRTSSVSARLQSRIDDLQNKTSDLERRMAEQATTAKKERISLSNRLVAKDAQMNQLRSRLIRMEREPNRPDGAVVDATADLVWIDAGSRHGLKRGTRFDVFEYGKGKTKRLKGEVQVRELENDSAVCAVVRTLDRWNPIAAGDMISNPYFDREKTPEFVFLGVMPGRFGNDEMQRLLAKNGAVVTSNVSANTDFLVVGDKPESEDEIPLAETDTFRLATQFGVEIISGRELERLLRF